MLSTTLFSSEVLAVVPRDYGVMEDYIIGDLVAAASGVGQRAGSAALTAFQAGKFKLACALAEASGVDDRSRAALARTTEGTMTPRGAWAIGVLLKSGVEPSALESSVRRATDSLDPEVVRICLRVCGTHESLAPLLVRSAVEALGEEDGEAETAAGRVLGNLAALPEDAADAIRNTLTTFGSQMWPPLVDELVARDTGCRFLITECRAGRLATASLSEALESLVVYRVAPTARDDMLRLFWEKGRVLQAVGLCGLWARQGWHSPECDRCLLAALNSDADTLAYALWELRCTSLVDLCDDVVLRRCWELAQDHESQAIAAKAIYALAQLSVPSKRLGRAIEMMLPRAEGAQLANLLGAAQHYAEVGGTVRIPIDRFLASDDGVVSPWAIWAAAYVAPDRALAHLVRRIEAGEALDAPESGVLGVLAQRDGYRERCGRLLEEQARLAALVPRPDLVLTAASGLIRSDPDGGAARRSVSRLIKLLEERPDAWDMAGYWEGALEMLVEMKDPQLDLVRRCEKALRAGRGPSDSAYRMMLRMRGLSVPWE